MLRSLRSTVSRSYRSYTTSSQRIYNSFYPPIDTEPQSTWSLIQNSIKEKKSSPALICAVTDEVTTFGEFDEAVKRVAASFAQRGIKKGDIVLTNIINCKEYPILYHALTALGAILSPAAPTFSGQELAQQITASKATTIVTHITSEAAAKDAADLLSIPYDKIYSIGNTGSLQPFSVLYESDPVDIQSPPIDAAKEVNYLPFSSGTTGPPKGVQLSFWNLAVNTLQWQHMEKFVSPALVVLPYYHIYGTTLMNATLLSGYPQVILPKFDPEVFLRALQNYKIQKGHIAPPIAGFLAKHPLVDKYDLSATKYLISGAAPMGAELENAVYDRLGIKIKQAYGMTELSPVSNYSHDDSTKPSSTGHILPSTELRVVCPGSNEDLPTNKVGELWYRGPQVMLGYLNNDDATNATMTSCGFLKTGDLGYIDDDGHVYVVDRLKELIKYKGHQVAPAEIEDVIMKHPKVLDAACIRGYDEDRQEVPKACVVLKPNESLTAEELMEYVASQVAPFKKVRQVVFIDAIPKTGSGKILRRELQAKY